MKKTYELIRDLREDNTFTQQEIADYLDIKRTMYRRYETGETEIPIRHLKKLCILYKVSSDYFIGLKIEKLNQKGTIKMTRVDFIIFDQSFKVRTIIELNNASMNRDIVKEEILKEMGYKVIHTDYITQETLKQI